MLRASAAIAKTFARPSVAVHSTAGTQSRRQGRAHMQREGACGARQSDCAG